MTAVDEVWHELVLNGIGGRTIAEAKETMTHAEFVAWCDFKRRRGSLFLGNRLESGFALMAWMFQKAHGGTMEIESFMPHADEKIATISDVLGAFVSKR